MRPKFHELFEGFIHTWEHDIFPVVFGLGKRELIRQIIPGTALLHLLDSYWESEGENLYNDNKELNQGLQHSVPALRRSGLDEVVRGIETQLAKEYVPRGGYPTLKALQKENYDLKGVLEKTMVAMAEVKAPSTSLKNAQSNLHRIIKRQVERDVRLYKLIRGIFAEPEKIMDKTPQPLE